MKNKPRIQSTILLCGMLSALLFAGLFSGTHVLARQAASTAPANPCTDQATAETKKELDFEPFADPAEVLKIRAEKKMEEKNFKELQDAATQLASLSGKMSQEIDKGGQYAISLHVMDELNQIDKLTKKVRSLAK